MDNATTNTSYPDEGSGYLDSEYFLKVFLMVALSLVFLLGTVGNGLVIWFVAFKMKKTVNSVWFLNLAIADMTFSLFQPFEILNVDSDVHWPFGDFMCKMASFVLALNMFSSILQLTVISVDRCLCVVSPVWCRNHRTTRLALVVTVGIWIVSVACSIPYLLRKMTFANDDGSVSCTEFEFVHIDDSLHETRIIMRFIIFFVAPLIIIVLCYAVIILRIRRSHSVRSTKPFKMIAAVIVTFFVCWLPFHIFSYTLEHALNSLNNDLYIISINGLALCTALAYMNSCINPFLYVFFGRDFREKFWGSIQSALRRAFTEDPDWIDSEEHTAPLELSTRYSISECSK